MAEILILQYTLWRPSVPSPFTVLCKGGRKIMLMRERQKDEHSYWSDRLVWWHSGREERGDKGIMNSSQQVWCAIPNEKKMIGVIVLRGCKGCHQCPLPSHSSNDYLKDAFSGRIRLPHNHNPLIETENEAKMKQEAFLQIPRTIAWARTKSEWTVTSLNDLHRDLSLPSTYLLSSVVPIHEAIHISIQPQPRLGDSSLL